MLKHVSIAALAAVAFTGPAAAETFTYGVDLSELNDSGVSGEGTFAFDSVAQTLSVHLLADGLEPGQPHPQHIHGATDDDGNIIDAKSPTTADDTDGDGFVELLEAAGNYGPIIVPLTDPAGGAIEDFPTAPDGSIDFSNTYDITDSGIFANDFDAGNLAAEALENREIVLHGMTVGADFGVGTDGEVDGTAGYKAVLPVASGEITARETPAPVPLPAAAWLLMGGIGGLGALRARRRS